MPPRELIDDLVALCYHCSMSQPVKLSDELVLDARLTAEVAERSIAGQIEYWAQLGRALEPLLQGAQALALRRAGAVKPLSECLESVDSLEGRRRVAEYLREPAVSALRTRAECSRVAGSDRGGWNSNCRTVCQSPVQGSPWMKFPESDKRPIIVALAGPNGAGKTTFYDSHLRHAALRFINADVLARELGLDPYVAADLANSLRRDFVKRGESFIFETVFSDPVGDKLAFLKEAAKSWLHGGLVLHRHCWPGIVRRTRCHAYLAGRA